MLNKLQMQIKSLERHSGTQQRMMILGTDDLNQCSDDKLKRYLEYLRNKEDDIESSEVKSSDIPEAPPTTSEVSIAVAPAIENHQCVRTLACCYLWLTSKNMSERKGVMFRTPRPFQELAHLLHEVPAQADWTTWNRLHNSALEKFLTSNENAEEYKRSLKEVMCETPHWWREKSLANSENYT